MGAHATVILIQNNQGSEVGRIVAAGSLYCNDLSARRRRVCLSVYRNLGGGEKSRRANRGRGDGYWTTTKQEQTRPAGSSPKWAAHWE